MTSGEKICHVECYCKNIDGICMPCQIDEVILREKEPLRKKIIEYENGFWAKVAVKLSYSIKQLKKKLNDYESVRPF